VRGALVRGAAALAAVLALVRPAAAAEPVVVFAASSLTNVLQAAADAYERETGVHVLINVGASNSQARQIVQGAPADVFCSADEEQMDVVERAGFVAAGTRVALAANRLVIVVPSTSSVRAIANARELLEAAFQQIAIGDPAAVPVGVYTKAYLTRVGLWEALRPKLVPTVNVRAALAAVDTGNADAAFVYATDAPIARHAIVAYRVPPDQAPPIRYPGAVVTGGANRVGGAAFLDYLKSAKGAAFFRRFGFAAP
jgi:molybdate transport system substrate-binding protein